MSTTAHAATAIRPFQVDIRDTTLEDLRIIQKPMFCCNKPCVNMFSEFTFIIFFKDFFIHFVIFNCSHYF